MVYAIKGTHVIQYHAVRLSSHLLHVCRCDCPQNGPDQPPVTIDFTPPFRRISMIEGLEECLKTKLPAANEYDKEGVSLAEVSFLDHYLNRDASVP
jgi:lysyl-tRNA synthetase class 2